MLKGSEYAQLRATRILEQVESRSGKSRDEIDLEVRLARETAYNYLKALGLTYPEPSDRSIRKIDTGTADHAYRGQRSIPGKGIDKPGVVSLTVITSIAVESDSRLWFHASLTRADRKMPNYADLCWLKQKFFGDRWAIQMFPAAEQHVSDHESCLHLWTCLEPDFSLPDFRKFGTI